MQYNRLYGSNAQPPNLMCTSGICHTASVLPTSATCTCSCLLLCDEVCIPPTVLHSLVHTSSVKKPLLAMVGGQPFLRHLTLWALGTMSCPFLCDTLVAQVVMTANSFVWSFISMPHTPQDDAAARRVWSSTPSFDRSLVHAHCVRDVAHTSFNRRCFTLVRFFICHCHSERVMSGIISESSRLSSP